MTKLHLVDSFEVFKTSTGFAGRDNSLGTSCLSFVGASEFSSFENNGARATIIALHFAMESSQNILIASPLQSR